MRADQNRFCFVWIGRLAVAAGVLILSNCGKKEETPAPGTFGSVYSISSTSNCSSCHRYPSTGSAEVQGARVDFSSKASLYAALTAQFSAGSGSGAACSTVRLVQAGNASSSMLTALLFSDLSSTNFAGAGGCTPSRAHDGSLNLTADERASIIAWINNGAQNN